MLSHRYACLSYQRGRPAACVQVVLGKPGAYSRLCEQSQVRGAWSWGRRQQPCLPGILRSKQPASAEQGLHSKLPACVERLRTLLLSMRNSPAGAAGSLCRACGDVCGPSGASMAVGVAGSVPAHPRCMEGLPRRLLVCAGVQQSAVKLTASVPVDMQPAACAGHAGGAGACPSWLLGAALRWLCAAVITQGTFTGGCLCVLVASAVSA